MIPFFFFITPDIHEKKEQIQKMFNDIQAVMTPESSSFTWH